MRKSFFSRQSLVVMALGALAVYLVFALISIGVKKVAYERQRAAVRAAQQRFDALSPAEKAIRKAEAYQAHMITTVRTSQRLIFDYLQRTYNLDERLSVAKTPITIPNKGPDDEVGYMARIAFPKQIHKDTPTIKPIDGVSYTNVYSINCDIFPLPAEFWQAMQQEYKQGSYYLTHGALAFRFLRDNKCEIPDNAKVLESQINRGMVALAADEATVPDLRYEAIAFLLLNGQRSEVKQQWIDQLIHEQLPEGAWAGDKEQKRANEHSTLLALWALLQYSRPDVEYQPLIRRPTTQ